jgi:hypothetical protein
MHVSSAAATEMPVSQLAQVSLPDHTGAPRAEISDFSRTTYNGKVCAPQPQTYDNVHSREMHHAARLCFLSTGASEQQRKATEFTLFSHQQNTSYAPAQQHIRRLTTGKNILHQRFNIVVGYQINQNYI